ncbi:CRAL-TRIO domain-containing protein [Xylariaceae sp. FL0255]|nr:CRAL-TRIO domain-containing protein [Xylariaceae sp. FL0255]
MTNDKADGNDLRRLPSAGAVELGFPLGHLGRLTEEEKKALAEFKVLLECKGLYKPGPPPSHSDPTLLRYLRARKWVVQDAYGQFNETERFRRANQIDVLYDTIDIDSYEESRRLYPRYTGRRDRRGIPIYVFQIRHLDSKLVSDYEKSSTYSKAKTDGKTHPKFLRLFALYENLTRHVQPLTTECPDRPNTDVPITLSTNIVDIGNVSLRQFWNLKGHMQAASQLATAHYPEILDRIFIVGAPYFFSTVWGWIKRWFDPVTVSKIFILSDADVLPVLTTFMDIKDIPKVYGGELEWTFFDEPAWDDGIMNIIKWENGHTDFGRGPVFWQPSADGERMECVAVGSLNGTDRHEVIASVPKSCRPKMSADVEEPEPTNSIVANGEKAESTIAESAAEAVADLKISDDAKKNPTAELSEKIPAQPAPPAAGATAASA